MIKNQETEVRIKIVLLSLPFEIAVSEIVEVIRSSQLSIVLLVRIDRVLCVNLTKIWNYVIREVSREHPNVFSKCRGNQEF